jgi:hypothetical protein
VGGRKGEGGEGMCVGCVFGSRPPPPPSRRSVWCFLNVCVCVCVRKGKGGCGWMDDWIESAARGCPTDDVCGSRYIYINISIYIYGYIALFPTHLDAWVHGEGGHEDERDQSATEEGGEEEGGRDAESGTVFWFV